MPRSPSEGHIDTPKKFGKRLRSARIQAGLSQRQLAFKGCSIAYISRLENGMRNPSLQVVFALADRIGVRRTWLATAEEEDANVESYRSGYHDALIWVMRECDLEEHDRNRLLEITA